MRRSTILAGLILIAVGLLLLVLPLFPNVASFVDIGDQWPLIIVGVGVLFLVGAFLGSPSLAVPGSIVGGIGLLLYYQNLTGDWASWAYAWALIPAFVGVGVFISRLLEGKAADGAREGGRLILIGLVMFLIFGAFLGQWVSLSLLGPILLILFGLWLLVRNLLRRGKSRGS